MSTPSKQEAGTSGGSATFSVVLEVQARLGLQALPPCHLCKDSGLTRDPLLRPGPSWE